LNNEARVVASVFALSGFAIAIVAGMYAGNDAGTVLRRALGAMVACQIVGTMAGWIVQRVITDHEARYRNDHPMPKQAREEVIVVDEAVDNAEESARAAA
jgi:hypothetical protein